MNMATITEDYVSFETAKLLKEKGFMEGAIIKFFASGYDSKGNILDIRDTELKDYPRPTLQMAMKWLREIHRLHIYPDYVDFIVHDKVEVWVVKIVDMKTFKDYSFLEDTYSSYEQTCEAAIKYCLKNLI